MAKELELKITDIDKAEVLEKLKKLGAEYVGTFNYKRIIALPKHQKKGYESWFRVRTDGNNDNVITFKIRKLGTEMVPMEKFQVKIDSVSEAVEILKHVTKQILYFENKRIQYMLGGLKITVDKWPYLPWSLEIEGDTEEQILEGFKRLNVKGRIVGNASGGEGYKLYGMDYEKIGKEKFHKVDAMMAKEFMDEWVHEIEENEVSKNLDILNKAIRSNKVK